MSARSKARKRALDVLYESELRGLPVGGTLGDRRLYAESFEPLLDFGWSPLRSVRQDGWKVIDDERNSRGVKSLKDSGREPRYIQTAADFGIGIGDH